jgi:anthranilate phosphoribosyltransferase
VTVADELEALGGPGRPTPAESEAMLARAGVAVVHVGEALPGWEAVAGVREEIGLRGPLHSAEKLVDWFGATRFVVGHTHSGYGAKLLGALEHLGVRHAIAVRGIEGSDVLRPGRPVAATLAGALELPEQLGLALRGDSDPEVAARLTRAVLQGEDDGPAYRAVTLSAAVRLLAAGVARDVADGLRRAEAAIAEGVALARLDALLAA